VMLSEKPVNGPRIATKQIKESCADPNDQLRKMAIASTR
jgi:hypothetical protein